MKVGSIQIDPVLDGRTTHAPEEILDLEGRPAWDCHADPLDDDGQMVLELGGHLIRTRDRVILVDAGIGSLVKDGYVTGQLPDSLRRLNVSFDDVTDVVFTHLHFDHVGWATQRGEVMFPHATYRVHSADWEHFITGPQFLPGAAKKLAPIEPQLEMFDNEWEFAPGVRARPTPGHTPGSTVYVVADQGERALLLGDAVHTVSELTDPEWECLFDLDRAAARAVRNRIASDAIENGDALAAAHFPGLRFGRLVAAGEGRRFEYL